jgi:hypothetical protein
MDNPTATYVAPSDDLYSSNHANLDALNFIPHIHHFLKTNVKENA